MLSDGTDLYEDPALYELEHANYRGDLAFYRLVAAQARPPAILELGCGLGRVAFELAAAGYSVTGLELAPEMLAKCERRRLQLPRDVRQRVQLQLGDARHHRDPPARYGAVIAPFNLLQHQDATGLAELLRAARASLVEEGRFACDLFAPLAVDAELDDADFTGLENRPLSRDGGTLLVDRRECYDRASAVLTTLIRHRRLRADGSLAGSEQRTVCRRQWTHDQLSRALAAAGFVAIDCYGDVDLTPYHPAAPRIMLVARRG
ncbi:MAG: class I SAM-dependent methyltransferase [Deltaproteobacteria bacterium]|nr:class I SAM-dependent methyltransferase [Deltaproteobacteria bacterium]